MILGEAAFALYRGAGRLAAPFAGAHLARRARRGKEDPARLGEKMGLVDPLPGPAPIWLHAVSVGESVAAMALAEALIADDFAVLMTTGTPTAARRIAAADVGVAHRYAPLDAPPFVARFLDRVRPAAALFTESEIWPATVDALARRGVPRAQVNARMSERSFRRWQRLAPVSRTLFSKIPLVLAQSTAEAERWRALGVADSRATGNLKFDAAPPTADAGDLAALRAAVGARPVWLAASIHPGEEDAVLAAHRQVLAARPDILTIIAPRHTETAEKVLGAANGLAVRRRSRGEAPDAPLYLADTLGEMGTFFSLAPVVFLGGSFVPLGGHNPAEPAAFGAAMLTGESFGEMFVPFLDAGAAALVTDGVALGQKVATLLSDLPGCERAGAAARAVLQTERGAVARTMEALGELRAAARARR